MDKTLEAIDKALDMVSALCMPKDAVGSRQWVMSIPARPDYDPDLVIADALEKAKGLIKEREVLICRIIGHEEEISEIVRVARDYPDDLVAYIKKNYPNEWGQE